VGVEGIFIDNGCNGDGQDGAAKGDVLGLSGEWIGLESWNGRTLAEVGANMTRMA